MKAATYVSAGNLQLLDQPKPVIKNPTDAIVRVLKTTICGTDLHILGGDVPACKEGTILGHEGIGIVEEVGDAVNNFKVGDKVKQGQTVCVLEAMKMQSNYKVSSDCRVREILVKEGDTVNVNQVLMTLEVINQEGNAERRDI